MEAKPESTRPDPEIPGPRRIKLECVPHSYSENLARCIEGPVVREESDYGTVQFPGPFKRADETADLLVHLAGLREIPSVVLANLRRVLEVRRKTLRNFLRAVREVVVTAVWTVRMSRAEVQAEGAVPALLKELDRLIQVIRARRELVVEPVRRGPCGRKVPLPGCRVLVSEVPKAVPEGPDVG